MKIPGIHLAGAALVALLATTTESHAALVAEYSEATVPVTGNNIPAVDWADHVNATAFTPSDSAFTRRGTGFSNYRGWGTSIDTTRFVSFQLSADPGYQLNLTDFAFTTASTITETMTFQWGMRIDNGSGFGAWVFSPLFTPGTPGYDDPNAVKDWDFADVSTTGTVQFALFASAPDAITAITAFRAPSFVNGSVSQVPEASSLAAGLAAGAAFLVRRRR